MFKKIIIVLAISLLAVSGVAFARHRYIPPPPPPPTNATLVTNEYAYWHPNDPLSIKSPIWEMDSGSLFLKNGLYWTGVPADKAPNYNSTTGNNSAVFRLNTKNFGYQNFTVSFNLNIVGMTTTKTTPVVNWDGVHVFLRYQSEYNLYYASVKRRDGNMVIKKKCPGGVSNNGTYYDLSSYTKLNTPSNIKVSIQNQTDGSVKIDIYNGNTIILTGIDKGIGCSVISRAGATGIRGDNTQFYFGSFTIQ